MVQYLSHGVQYNFNIPGKGDMPDIVHIQPEFLLPGDGVAAVDLGQPRETGTDIVAMALLGIVAKVSFPDITATMALPKVVMSLNPVASGTTLAALWAADVSTACTILLGAGTLFSQDIYKRFINPSVSDEKFVTVNRLTIFGVGLITLWFAFNAAGILKTMIAGLSMTTALTCVFLFTVFAPGLCRRSSAFYTTLVGLLGLVVWEFVPALHVLQHVIYFEWLICIVTFLIVAVVDKTPIKVPEYVEEEA